MYSQPVSIINGSDPRKSLWADADKKHFGYPRVEVVHNNESASVSLWLKREDGALIEQEVHNMKHSDFDSNTPAITRVSGFLGGQTTYTVRPALPDKDTIMSMVNELHGKGVAFPHVVIVHDAATFLVLTMIGDGDLVAVRRPYHQEEPLDNGAVNLVLVDLTTGAATILGTHPCLGGLVSASESQHN